MLGHFHLRADAKHSWEKGKYARKQSWLEDVGLWQYLDELHGNDCDMGQALWVTHVVFFLGIGRDTSTLSYAFARARTHLCGHGRSSSREGDRLSAERS